MIAIDNIISMILVNFLPDEIKYMKDLMFSNDLMGEFPDFKETLKAMMTYEFNKQKVDVLPTVVVPPGPTIMSAATAIPTTSTQVKCGLCSKMFNKVLLAANVAVKGLTSDPIIPSPTQRERNTINNFMELQHYSMTTTTINTDPTNYQQLNYGIFSARLRILALCHQLQPYPAPHSNPHYRCRWS